MATPAGDTAALNYGVSAGLDALSGVFGYLASLENADIQRSRADLIRAEAQANAQRYGEQAAQFQAKEKVMYLSSGVKLAGSPVDALATSARIANENMAAIEMAGERDAMNEQVAGVNSENQGRAALTGGLAAGTKTGFNALAAIVGSGGGASKGGMNDMASLFGFDKYGA